MKPEQIVEILIDNFHSQIKLKSTSEAEKKVIMNVVNRVAQEISDAHREEVESFIDTYSWLSSNKFRKKIKEAYDKFQQERSKG